MAEIYFPKYSHEVPFTSIISHFPPAPESKIPPLHGHRHPKSAQKLVSRGSLRRKLALDNEQIPPRITSNMDSSQHNTLGRKNSTASEVESIMSDNSLIDLSPTSHNASSLHDPRRSGTMSKFLLDDLFSPSVTIPSSSSVMSFDQIYASTVDENDPAVKLAHDLNFSCRETVNIVSRQGKLVSYVAKGSYVLKVKHSSRRLSDTELGALLASQELSLTAYDSLSTVKSWEISSALFESLPSVEKPRPQEYLSKVKIIGDDRKLLFGANGLNLFEYDFSVMPTASNDSLSKVPLKVQNRTSAPVVMSANPSSSTIDFFLSVDFDFPESLEENGMELKLRGTKVQVALNAIMGKVTIEDVTMQPSGSYDRNKRIITWEKEEVALSESKRLEFRASMKFPSEQSEAVNTNNYLDNLFLPTMVRTQMQQLLSGIVFTDARFGGTSVPLKLSKSTQLEYKIA